MPRLVSTWTLTLALSATAAFGSDAAPAPAGRPALPNPRFTGLPFVTAWNADDYGAGPINYATVQHPLNGFIYAANNFGVLEFDGAAWRLVRSGNNDVVPIVVIDPRGTVWLGGSNEVAVLRPDDRGELRAKDVITRLPAAERNFGRLYLGAAAPDGVYLAGPSRLLFFGVDGTARSWRPGPTNINGVHWHDGALHVSLGSGGLARLENDSLVPAAPAPRSLNPALRDTLRLLAIGRAPAGPGSLLLTNIGPLRWAGPGAPLAPFSAAATAEFAGESATAAAFLPDGRFAFAFPRRGLLILAADGTVSALFDRARGFDGSRIDHLATDNQGGLWLARLTGLARLQIDSRFALHGAFDVTREFLRRGDRLYLSHYQGAAWRDDATGRFHSATGLPSGLKTLLRVGDRLFGTGQFLYEITAPGRAVVALPLALNGLIPVRQAPGWFAGAGVAGLSLLRFDAAGWHHLGLVSGVDGSVTGVHQDADGSVWAVGYPGSGSWRVDFNAGVNLSAPVEFLPESRTVPTALDAPQSRALRLTGIEEGLRDLRDPAFLARAAASAEPAAASSNVRIARFLAVEKQRRTGAAPDTAPRAPVAPAAAPAGPSAPPLDHGPLATLVPNAVYADAPTRTLWVGNQGALLSIDPTWRPAQPPAPFPAHVRRLATAAGELLWAHAPFGAADSPATPPAAVTLDATRNSLRFTFAAPVFAPDYRGVSRLLYRTRLAGLEHTWSPWSPTPWREFTNLPYRDFVFHVQARDLDQRESTVGTLAVSLTPPWFLRRWAFAGYALATLASLVAFFRHRTRALRLRNERLEALVARRTADLARSNADLADTNATLAGRNTELARLHRLELDEKISARLAEEKARLEVLRYQLNPHFLFNSLNSIYTLVWSQSRPAGDLVRRLAEFCRLTLTRGGDTATLAEEFATLRAYLDLERARWHDQLAVEIDLDPAVAERRLPPFLLLPLVENAIKYGGHTSPGLLRLRLSARALPDGAAVVEIANSGTWVEPDSRPEIASTGIGLENLRQRLARHLPGRHAFSIGPADGGVVARLEFR